MAFASSTSSHARAFSLGEPTGSTHSRVSVDVTAQSALTNGLSDWMTVDKYWKYDVNAMCARRRTARTPIACSGMSRRASPPLTFSFGIRRYCVRGVRPWRSNSRPHSMMSWLITPSTAILSADGAETDMSVIIEFR